jgi:NitT/TauT family transport system substrate-binding protein
MKIIPLILLVLFFNTLIAEEKVIFRVGHFPNITHAQGLIGHQLTRQGKGWFEERLGKDVEVQWYVFDAGPSAMEAIFAGSIDLTYVGPSPSINAFVKSKGEEIRIISGACSGGVALIVQPDDRIKEVKDFKGKKIATPQFGNTQDIAARAWFKSQGFNIKINGGDLFIVPTSPADQLTLFKNGGLDGSWAIEPWASRLVLEAKGKVYLEESSLWPETNGHYVTTQLVARKTFIEKHPDLIKKWVAAHVELTEWINAQENEAKELVSQEFKAETKFELSPAILDRSWKNLTFTYDPISASLFKYAKEAFTVGLIKQEMNLEGIYDLKYLNEVLKEKGKPTVN